MANPEQLEILRQGVKEWNAWRAEKLVMRPGLHDAKLYGVNLDGANLGNADLIRADLSGADLSGADLSGADLTGAQLYGANLFWANISITRLISTKLDHATLTGACLWETQRARWSIKDVICEYVYWDERRKEKNVYAPGQFERLFADKIRI